MAAGLAASAALVAYGDAESDPNMRLGATAAATLEETVPNHLAGYRAQPMDVGDGVYDLVAAGELVFRVYAGEDGAPVWLWLSYYPDQRGSTVHSPSGCYAGLGWSVTEDHHTVENPQWPRRWLRVRREPEERLVLYWYETDYGPVATEFERNFLRMRGRLEGSTALMFVRLSTPLEPNADAARARLLRLAEGVRAAVLP